APLFRLVECVRMQVVTTLSRRLLFFDRDAMSVCISVLAYACHLPRDLNISRICLDREAVVLDFTSHYGLGELADDGELVPKITIQRIKPIWERDYCLAAPIGGDVAVVDVHHVW